MANFLRKLVSYLPGTKAWQKRKKLQELRVLLKAQGQDVSNLSDDQLEYVAMEVRRQVKESTQESTSSSDKKTLH
ncbi:hypothetical protein [Litoribrevibacter albus]|uniref:Uncharacterized protein n=1 Tax=Litoribrevibacter albus TaxID=1473156 RepID=A0AA37SBX2_9GAMM|nr:hypothetical protein [Litoribrevibacter albus]GLQ32536.1 hypothetical protein GCM10007876_30150 [Litoribrevibacter albus]